MGMIEILKVQDFGNFEPTPAKWSRTVLECSKIILEFSRTMF